MKGVALRKEIEEESEGEEETEGMSERASTPPAALGADIAIIREVLRDCTASYRYTQHSQSNVLQTINQVLQAHTRRLLV